jgi:HD-like signal output (HDOD) protein
MCFARPMPRCMTRRGEYDNDSHGAPLTAAILIAALLAFAGWIAFRQRARSPRSTGSATTPGMHPAPLLEAERLRMAADQVTQRLWRLAFGVPSQPAPVEKAHIRVRELINAVVQLDTLDPKYFPRRPSLLPQLLQAVNDPDAASEKLSRMIAHDPVLTADVLRLANSSLYRVSPAPIETIKRAIVVCGVDSLRGIIAAAMLQPVFRATRTNFPRLPRLLWERTERAARAAELYCAKRHPQDRFEAQLVVLLSALGPLVVYSAALDGYSRAPRLMPNPALFVELIETLGAQMSLRIARDWQTSPRLVAALERSNEESLATALQVGELCGTLSLLESQTVISRDERLEVIGSAGMAGDLDDIAERLAAD